MNKIPVVFPIQIFNQEKESDTLTKARLRIFYKGANRNGSYIGDEFAEKLIKTLPYTPVKGIYDEDDFTDHGKQRSDGRIYGVVPDESKMDFAWEKHVDEDGVEREYATTNVLIFSALYEEAEDVVGKAHSMELYGPSITGQWMDIGGNFLYKYSSASFLGLQILGDNATPCFEGSAFFSLDTLEAQRTYILMASIFEKLEQLLIGRINMPNENEYNPIFALSDSQKQNKIFQALNPEKVRYYVSDTYDTYAIVYDMETETYAKVAYTKDNATETITIGESMESVFGEFVTESEKAILNTLREMTEMKTFEATFEAFMTTISDMQVEIDNKDSEISTLNTAKETFEQTIGELNQTITDFESFKDTIETAEKEAVFTKYAQKMSEEILAPFKEKVSEFTAESLERELAYELVKNDESIFNLDDGNDGNSQKRRPKNQEPSGLEALLNKHKK